MARLIDADEVIEALIEEGQRSKRYKLGETWELNLDEIRKAIATVPTTQPKIERDKAIPPKWIAEDKFVKNVFYAYPYCPKCGYEIVTGDCYCRVCGQHIDWNE